jgi:hypothetical protein
MHVAPDVHRKSRFLYTQYRPKRCPCPHSPRLNS